MQDTRTGQDTVEVLWAPARVHLIIRRNATGISRIEFAPTRGNPGEAALVDDPLLRETQRQLVAYFAGDLRVFDLPLAPDGTAFQRRVWDAVSAVPYGETRTYLDIARELGQPAATRAVGHANGSNPLPIVVPCHRIIRTGGGLGGYGGGLDIKLALLKLEQANSEFALSATAHRDP